MVACVGARPVANKPRGCWSICYWRFSQFVLHSKYSTENDPCHPCHPRRSDGPSKRREPALSCVCVMVEVLLRLQLFCYVIGAGGRRGVSEADSGS